MQRYEARFVNGFHVCFDTEAYEVTQIFYLKREAEEAVKKMNQSKLQRAANA